MQNDRLSVLSLALTSALKRTPVAKVRLSQVDGYTSYLQFRLCQVSKPGDDYIKKTYDPIPVLTSYFNSTASNWSRNQFSAC